ncbi:MAG: hypothetical protein IKP00_17275 [Victivallales bacterium]|nr:hypothetical protein [Victivallales bacterium]
MRGDAHVGGRAARCQVRAVQGVLGDFFAHFFLVVGGEVQHLRGRVELAVDFCDEAVVAYLREVGQRLLHVHRAQRLVHLAAGAERRIERVRAEDAVLLLQRGLEGGHGGVVDLLGLREDQVAETRGGALALSLHREIAGGEVRLGGYGAESVYVQGHGGDPFRKDYTETEGRLQRPKFAWIARRRSCRGARWRPCPALAPQDCGKRSASGWLWSGKCLCSGAWR